LLPQHFGRTRFDGENTFGILRGETRNCAGTVDAERGKSFQISLDARAAAAVGTGDGERDGRNCSRNHNPNLNRNPKCRDD